MTIKNVVETINLIRDSQSDIIDKWLEFNEELNVNNIRDWHYEIEETELKDVALDYPKFRVIDLVYREKTLYVESFLHYGDSERTPEKISVLVSTNDIINNSDIFYKWRYDCIKKAVDNFDGFIKSLYDHYFYIINNDHPIFEKRKKRKSISKKTRYKLLMMANFKCQCCGKLPSTENNISLHIDHIIPISIGGKDTEANMQVLCNECNQSKNNKDSTDFRGAIKKLDFTPSII